MNKIEIKVPKGIQFMSNWEDYKIPKNCHCIVDKGVTGCGYTEFCLTNNENIILVSPRRILMENKIEQHSKDKNIFYAENDITDNESRKRYLDRIYGHIDRCLFEEIPCKIMVSYDSLHYVVDIINGLTLNSSFQYIVDEFQSIFLDSFFKADIELDFVDTLQRCQNVVYLSATPMLDKYLMRLDQFNSLDFYKLNWDETGYVETINIERKQVSSLTVACGKIITNYLENKFPITTNSKGEIVESKEAVFYLNSVNDITRIISKYELSSENTRIICSNTPDNVARLKKKGFKVGKVPLKGEENPMFMFCTSTSYVGVDFYSDNASSFVFADLNLKHLALDISLDLPQIIGRQRDKSNPFKNNIVIFYKTIKKKEDRYTKEDFGLLQKERKNTSEILLNAYNKMTALEKSAYLKKIRADIEVSKYGDDFVSISKESGLPVYNPLIELANERAWEVSQEDYQNSITVTKSIESLNNVTTSDYISPESKLISEFLDNEFFATGVFVTRMKAYCLFRDRHQDNSVLIAELKQRIRDQKYSKYYEFYGSGGCGTRNYVEKSLREGLKSRLSFNNDLGDKINEIFKVGEKYPKSEIKEILRSIFSELEIKDRKPKATLLSDYFNISGTKITLPNKKVVDGFKINGIKKEE